MELNEFKELWQSKAESKPLNKKFDSEKINEIIMKTNTTVGKLHHTNLFWWNFTKISIALLLASLALNILTFIISPEKFPQAGKALPFLGIIAAYGLATLWMYYEQVKIFDIKSSPNMRTAIETSIQRFKRFYTMINMVNLVMLPPVFYVGSLLTQMGFNQVELVLNNKEVWQCLILTILTMGASHLYYKRVYFKRINNLKCSLNELNEENQINP